jgi:hypothetical protein
MVSAPTARLCSVLAARNIPPAEIAFCTGS